MASKSKKELYDTSFLSIRRADPVDLPLIIDIITSEPYFRWKQVVQVLFQNIYVTVMWFIGALCVMAMSILYVAVNHPDFKSRGFYIILSAFTALIIFGLCGIKAMSLYFLRYVRAFEIRAELNKMDTAALSDNVEILKNEKIHFFWKMHTFYVAEPFDERSKKLLLGVISLTSYGDHCAEQKIQDSDFEVFARAVPEGLAIIKQKTIVISWLCINEPFFKKSKDGEDGDKMRDSTYHGLLQYVDRNVVQDTTINYVIAESDDFLYWQHDVLAVNRYGFCGERVDLKWDWYTEVEHLRYSM